MTSADASATGDGEPEQGTVAAEVLEAVLEPGPRRPVRRAVRAIGAVAMAAVGADAVELGREAQLVVRRIDTGREVLRTDAGHLADADQLLQRVRLDLRPHELEEAGLEAGLVGAALGRGDDV
ncbi:hypothetical protein, partial [Clavibacter phaseoli]|uniref:hypothetical protein n=1 Tax=Clavibacter phaseoli TaxID=1734031 RepID=UPI0021751312